MDTSGRFSLQERGRGRGGISFLSGRDFKKKKHGGKHRRELLAERRKRTLKRGRRSCPEGKNLRKEKETLDYQGISRSKGGDCLRG